ncbi:DUF418 domain-containing protein [Jeotgalibacillus sp. R-1-5s-1]|uniref:DUF418 domain-containing protein n=1 Tax=Jeotgalibacillus sp. R-1-5s-1 TaxID=2555897 RepID=UPI00106CC4A2|nr:DUF418 domain-containing protein [Jeotgalibacillus sp. R-1-5s-1]TFE00179.1 DUF418 domain-containing protein [Jeotgalibacillus sp. R-1-5s-1]
MTNRITVIDALRGLSLFGILLANMLIFQYGAFGKDELEPTSWIDKGALAFLKIFVETSFMPIFAFLFGYGIIKMVESLREKGLNRKRHLIRRMIFLIVLGIIHSQFVWEGDILFMYGATGFVLLFFVRRKVKTLLIWATVLLVLTSALSFGGQEFAVTPEEKARLSEYVADTNDIYQNGTYAEIMHHRTTEDPFVIESGAFFFILLFAPFMILPMFLYGMAAAKINVFSKLHFHRNTFKKAAIWLIPAGLLLKGFAYFATDLGISGSAYMLGGPLLAFGYIAFFSWFMYQNESLFVRGFAAIGRLSLTNYLMQSVICVIIFYGFGFGYFTQLGVFIGILLAVAIMAFQWVVSLWMMSIFKQGPFEKAIRMFTYWSLFRERKLPPEVWKKAQ